MLQNAYFLAKIGADTAENEQHFAEILPTDALDAGARGWRRWVAAAATAADYAPLRVNASEDNQEQACHR